jgi:catalase
MPLPSDEKIVQLANEILGVMRQLFGSNPGHRRGHSKGIQLSGTFTPAPGAASLSRAPHISRPSTPVLVRFSDTTGFPMIPDNDPNASPRGMAVRFYLAERTHTDLVCHSTNGFMVKNGQEFLEFVKAIASNHVAEFTSSHASTLAFIQAPNPNAVSYATEGYFSVTAVKFTNQSGAAKYGRYRIVPQAGLQYLEDGAAKSKGPNYLFDEIKERVARSPIKFDIQVQIADQGDVVNDCTVQWPESRPLVSLGTLTLTELSPDDDARQKVIFDPIPRVDGVEPSEDPLLELRAAAYLIAGRQRRQEIDSAKSVPDAKAPSGSR